MCNLILKNELNIKKIKLTFIGYFTDKKILKYLNKFPLIEEIYIKKLKLKNDTKI